MIKGYQKDMKSLPIKKGDIVLIKKGITYHSMRDGDMHSAKKSYKVKVDHILNGAEWGDHHGNIVKNPEVTWAGSGGYWCRADINHVILQNDFLTEKEMYV